MSPVDEPVPSEDPQACRPREDPSRDRQAYDPVPVVLSPFLRGYTWDHPSNPSMDVMAIGMQKRYVTHFIPLQKEFKRHGYRVQWFQGIDGKGLVVKDLPLTPSYQSFFTSNRKEFRSGKTKNDYRGHLGCTLSHLSVLHRMRRMTLVVEDDVNLSKDFRKKLSETLRNMDRLDPDWEVLLLGWVCSYADNPHCCENDHQAIRPGGLVKVGYWIGGWGYVVRSSKVAQKIVSMFTPIFKHIDLGMADLAREGKLNVYGRIPPLVHHPGWMRISSFNLTQHGDVRRIRSDTNY